MTCTHFQHFSPLDVNVGINREDFHLSSRHATKKSNFQKTTVDEYINSSKIYDQSTPTSDLRTSASDVLDAFKYSSLPEYFFT